MLNFPKNKSIGNMYKSGMPQMDTTLTGWEVPLVIIQITQDVIDGELVTSKKQINFKGVWQPLKDEALELKPEGQRSWAWYWIHAKTGELNLDTADKIIFRGKKYKVMNKKDYDLNGFVEYEVILDYENS